MTFRIFRFGPEPKHFTSKSIQPLPANFRTIGNYAAHNNLEQKTDYQEKIEHLNEVHVAHIDARLNQSGQIMEQILEDDSAQVTKLCDYSEKHHTTANQQERDIIQTALKHRLAPKLVHINAQWTIIRHIQEVANKDNIVNYIASPSDLLAIDSTEFYNTLTNSDLQDCVHRGDTYLCKGRRELRTDTEQDCLTSLNHIWKNGGFQDHKCKRTGV